jgi:hypothetical protein
LLSIKERLLEGKHSEMRRERKTVKMRERKTERMKERKSEKGKVRNEKWE